MTCPRKHDMWVVGSGQDTTMLYNLFDMLPGSARNSENTDTWKQFLDLVSYFHYSPFWSITRGFKSQGKLSLDFSLAPNVWCLYQEQPIFQIPTGIQQVNLLLIQKLWNYCRFFRLRAPNCPQVRSQWPGLESLMLVTKWLKSVSSWPYLYIQ